MLHRLLLRVLFVGFLLLDWALLEPATLVVHTERIQPAGWNAPPLRVALLSDLHIGSPWNDLDRLRDIVARTNALDADLVLLLGDYDINGIAGGQKVRPEDWAPILGELRARGPSLPPSSGGGSGRGVYAVLGNHDWWNDEAAIQAALEENGIPVLENRAVHLDGLWLVGIGDEMTKHDKVRRAFSRVPKNATVLAMTHGPAVFDDPAFTGDLLVAGHTHGGQVAFPLLGAPAVPDGPVRGHYQRHGCDRRGRSAPRGPPSCDLWVTSGVGTSILPFRLGVPPEIVLLEVTAPDRV